MIELKSVNQKYGGTQILWDLDLKIEKGSRTCIMGRNGVGKTTLLKTIMGLLPISSGSITINDVDMSKSSVEKRPEIGVGYVPQGRHIFPQLTVEENLKISEEKYRDLFENYLMGYGMRTEDYRLIVWKDYRDLNAEPVFVELYDHTPYHLINIPDN